jgi:hypothetical protein
MGFNIVPTVTTGDSWSATNHNTYIRDNFAEIWKGTAAGDIDYYDSATTKVALAKPSVDSFLKNTSAGVPSWAYAVATLIKARQGGSTLNYYQNGTTNITPVPENTKIFIGSANLSFSSSATASLQVNYPEAFNKRPLVICSVQQNSGIRVNVYADPSQNDSYFTIYGEKANTLTSTYIVAWIAIGE